jgi:hypothetical protein
MAPELVQSVLEYILTNCEPGSGDTLDYRDVCEEFDLEIWDFAKALNAVVQLDPRIRVDEFVIRVGNWTAWSHREGETT